MTSLSDLLRNAEPPAHLETWPCKVDGCEGLAYARTGIYAYLCGQHLMQKMRARQANKLGSGRTPAKGRLGTTGAPATPGQVASTERPL